VDTVQIHLSVRLYDCIIIFVGVSHGVATAKHSIQPVVLVQRLLARDKAVQANIVKLHLLLHLPTSMEDLGPAACFNTERLY